MLIDQYGLYLQVTLLNDNVVQRNIHSFDDIPDTRLEEIRSCNILSNSKLIFSFDNSNITVYNSVGAKSIGKALPGWQLRYYIKRVSPNIFKYRGKNE